VKSTEFPTENAASVSKKIPDALTSRVSPRPLPKSIGSDARTRSPRSSLFFLLIMPTRASLRPHYPARVGGRRLIETNYLCEDGPACSVPDIRSPAQKQPSTVSEITQRVHVAPHHPRPSQGERSVSPFLIAYANNSSRLETFSFEYIEVK
jgi:hypothetical protein